MAPLLDTVVQMVRSGELLAAVRETVDIDYVMTRRTE